MEKIAGQTQPGMPLVRIDNLMKGAGDIVSLDLVDTVGGEPLMGDVNREGKGSTLSFSSMEIKIDLASKVIDAGGSMSQQRTRHNLREIALAQLSGYFPRLDTQESLVHLAGARGSQIGTDWTIPLQTAVNFAVSDGQSGQGAYIQPAFRGQWRQSHSRRPAARFHRFHRCPENRPPGHTCASAWTTWISPCSR